MSSPDCNIVCVYGMANTLDVLDLLCVAHHGQVEKEAGGYRTLRPTLIRDYEGVRSDSPRPDSGGAIGQEDLE